MSQVSFHLPLLKIIEQAVAHVPAELPGSSNGTETSAPRWEVANALLLGEHERVVITCRRH
jgi:hypothetical protein